MFSATWFLFLWRLTKAEALESKLPLFLTSKLGQKLISRPKVSFFRTFSKVCWSVFAYVKRKFCCVQCPCMHPLWLPTVLQHFFYEVEKKKHCISQLQIDISNRFVRMYFRSKWCDQVADGERRHTVRNQSSEKRHFFSHPGRIECETSVANKRRRRYSLQCVVICTLRSKSKLAPWCCWAKHDWRRKHTKLLCLRQVDQRDPLEPRSQCVLRGRISSAEVRVERAEIALRQKIWCPPFVVRFR